MNFLKINSYRNYLSVINILNFSRKHVFLLTLILWITVVASRLWLNGFVFGLDYSLYHPDGAHYAFRTLSFLFESDYQAAIEVSNWYAVHGIKHNIIAPSGLLPENNPVWNLVAPRLLYPILSIPFVFVFGLSGMLAIPILSLLGLLLVINAIARFYGRPEFGLLFNLLLLTSVTISRWFVANITDGLLTFLVALLILVELKVKKLSVWAIYVGLLVFLSSITRFSIPIFLTLGLGYLILSEYKKALLLFSFASTSAIPLLFFNVQSAFLPGADNQSIAGKLVEFPVQSIKVFVVEIGQLVVLDRQLLFLILFALFCALQIMGTTGVLTVCVLLSVLLIGFINGTLGVNFRYQLPVVPFLAWSFVQYLSISRKSAEASLHVIGKETKE